MVNGHAVDLQSLLDWWPAPKGIRPLAGWKHVRGKIVQDTAFGWVINGKAEGQSHSTSFLLKSPPRDTLCRFEQLKKQLTELEAARTETLKIVARPVYTAWWYWPWSNRGHGQPISSAEHDQASRQLEELDLRIGSTRNELGPLQDEQGQFRVDAFALRSNESFQGMPVFDYGVPLQVHSQ
jgi:hypothetical protein